MIVFSDPISSVSSDPRHPWAILIPMYFLGIETSCDETAAAVFTDEPRVLANVIASQTDLHARFGGVVPEVAARAHLRQLLPVIDEALRTADVRLNQIGASRFTTPRAWSVRCWSGSARRRCWRWLWKCRLLAVNHVHAHVYACRIAGGRDIFPCVGFVVSGGHTALFRCPTAVDYELVGSTRDDAAGEAFDKVAAILGLGFPGGPAVDREAANGDPVAFRFPRSMLEADSLDFSFSGLKTAVLYTVQGQDRSKPVEPPTGRRRANIAASFQRAAVDVLVAKARSATPANWSPTAGGRRRRVGESIAAGGVASDVRTGRR